MVTSAFIIVALILLLLAAFAVAVPKVQIDLGWLGLAFYVLASVWVALKLPN